MPQTVTKILTGYTFSELSDSAQDHAHSKYGDVWFDWYEQIYDDAKDTAQILGFELFDIQFDLYHGQIAIHGYYSYKTGAKANLVRSRPKDSELHDIADALIAWQRKNLFNASAVLSINHRIEQNIRVDDLAENGDEAPFIDAVHQFRHWILAKLQSEYDYLTSREYFMDMCEANELVFDDQGNLV